MGAPLTQPSLKSPLRNWAEMDQQRRAAVDQNQIRWDAMDEQRWYPRRKTVEITKGPQSFGTNEETLRIFNIRATSGEPGGLKSRRVQFRRYIRCAVLHKAMKRAQEKTRSTFCFPATVQPNTCFYTRLSDDFDNVSTASIEKDSSRIHFVEIENTEKTAIIVF